MNNGLESFFCDNTSVLILGAGYVGTSLAIECRRAGIRVAVYDRSEDALHLLATKSDCELVFDFANMTFVPRVCIIAVNTPVINHMPDYEPLNSAVSMLGSIIAPGMLIINESTVSPGITRDLIGRGLESIANLSPMQDFMLSFSPERIDLGNSKFNLKTTPKLVAGITEEAAHQAISFYRLFVDDVSIAGTVEELEFTKLYENCYRAVGIGLANEISLAATRLGLNASRIFAASATKPFGFEPFRPGSGVGGDCIPTDPWHLIASFNKIDVSEYKILQAALEMNESMPVRVAAAVDILIENLKPAVESPRIVVLGLGYKPNQTSLMNSPALALISILRRRYTQIAVYDPLLANSSRNMLDDVLFLGNNELTNWNPTVGILCVLHDCILERASEIMFPLIDSTATLKGEQVYYV